MKEFNIKFMTEEEINLKVSKLNRLVKSVLVLGVILTFVSILLNYPIIVPCLIVTVTAIAFKVIAYSGYDYHPATTWQLEQILNGYAIDAEMENFLPQELARGVVITKRNYIEIMSRIGLLNKEDYRSSLLNKLKNPNQPSQLSLQIEASQTRNTNDAL
jgi:riboflavin transporter FmnP